MHLIKGIFLLSLLSLVVLLAGCTATPASLAPTQLEGTPPVATFVSPTDTSLPPIETTTATATEVPITPTVTAFAGNIIPHYPAGQEFTVTNIHMLDQNTGWAIGGLGSIVGDHVLVTSDGGTTWKDVTPPEVQPSEVNHEIAVGYFQDAQHAWVTYAVGGGNPILPQLKVWRTSDGGATWTASQLLDASGLSEIYVPTDLIFVNGTQGWLLSHVGVGMSHDYVALYRSSDGGVSWSRLLDPYNDGGIQSCTKNALRFTDATHGWLTGDCGGVKAGVLLFKSSDAGSTWQEVSLPAPADAPNLFSEGSNFACGSYDPYFFGNDLGHLTVLCTDYNQATPSVVYYIYSTQDGGTTWTSASYPGNSLYFFSSSVGWAASPKMHATTDGGQTWKAISDVTWVPQLDFVSEQLGWAVARSDTQMALVKTSNGGASWTILVTKVAP